MTWKQKRDAMRAALAVISKTPQIRAFLKDQDPKALEQVEQALAATTPMQKLSPEERAARAALKRFQQGRDRIIRYLKGVGIKKGGFGIHKETGVRIAFLGDPMDTPDGLRIPGTDSNDGGVIKTVDPLAYRPDFAAIDMATKPVKRVARKADTAEAPKAPKATKPVITKTTIAPAKQ